MIMNKTQTLLLSLAAFTLSSCIIETKHSPNDLNKQLVENKPPLARPLPRSYLRPVSKKEILQTQKITYSNPSASLLEVLTAVLPQYNIIPGDPGVEMTALIAVSVTNLSLSKFLDYLEGLTGYGIEYKQNSITIYSRMTKQWNLSALASLREYDARVGQTVSAITEGTETKAEDMASTTTKFDNSSKRAFHDQWDLLLKSARAIIGAPEKENFTPTFPAVTGEDTLTSFGIPAAYTASAPPFVVGNRSMGILLASGEPRRIKILDQYITNLERASSSQVNIDVKTFDVTLTDDRGAGIDWVALRENTKWNFKITSPTTTAWNPSITPITNLWSGFVNYKKGNNDVQATVRFLEKYGKVQLLNEPNVTVLNGTTAYLSSGDEFSFISDLEQRQDGSQAAKIVVTPKFSRIRVGVTMAVTPRLLKEGKILLDIIPVVSTLQGFKNIKVAGSNTEGLSEIETPNIALQELSTQVITRSGETIQLGGLMYKKIEEALTRIPTKMSPLTKLLDLAFKNDTSILKRRELVLLVTPTLIESKKWSP